MDCLPWLRNILLRKHKLYDSDSGSGLQLHTQSSPWERSGKFSQNGKFGQNGKFIQNGKFGQNGMSGQNAGCLAMVAIFCCLLIMLAAIPLI